MAVDSASTLLAMDPVGKRSGVAKIFNHATKLSQLRDYPIGVASWGLGTIGARSISSLVREFANRRKRLDEIEQSARKLSVKAEAKALQKLLNDAFARAWPDDNKQDKENKSQLGVLVGGYSGEEFFPEEYVFVVPGGKFAQKRKPHDDGSQNFGADWFGLTDALVRFHHGRDDGLEAILLRHGTEKQTAKKIIDTLKSELQYPVPFDGMPLQDAVDYAQFMAGLAVARYRFVMGPEMCGGPIDVAAITRQDGFVWIKQKDLEARSWVPTR